MSFKVVRSALFTLLTTALLAPACFAEGFPGKGDPADWSDALPYYNRGNRYVNQERYQDALNDYREAVAHYPYEPDFFTNMGYCYQKLGQYDAAEQAFKSATQLAPNDWAPWENLASAYAKQNKLKEALDTYNRTLKLKPPAAEQSAIESNIKGLKRILKAQGLLDEPEATTPGSKTGAKKGGKPAAGTASGGSPKANVPASKPAATKPGASAPAAKIAPPSQSDLKVGGWE